MNNTQESGITCDKLMLARTTSMTTLGLLAAYAAFERNYSKAVSQRDDYKSGLMKEVHLNELVAEGKASVQMPLPNDDANSPKSSLHLNAALTGNFVAVEVLGPGGINQEIFSFCNRATPYLLNNPISQTPRSYSEDHGFAHGTKPVFRGKTVSMRDRDGGEDRVRKWEPYINFGLSPSIDVAVVSSQGTPTGPQQPSIEEKAMDVDISSAKSLADAAERHIYTTQQFIGKDQYWPTLDKVIKAFKRILTGMNTGRRARQTALKLVVTIPQWRGSTFQVHADITLNLDLEQITVTTEKATPLASYKKYVYADVRSIAYDITNELFESLIGNLDDLVSGKCRVSDTVAAGKLIALPGKLGKRLGAKINSRTWPLAHGTARADITFSIIGKPTPIAKNVNTRASYDDRWWDRYTPVWRDGSALNLRSYYAIVAAVKAGNSEVRDVIHIPDLYWNKTVIGASIGLDLKVTATPSATEIAATDDTDTDDSMQTLYSFTYLELNDEIRKELFYALKSLVANPAQPIEIKVKCQGTVKPSTREPEFDTVTDIQLEGTVTFTQDNQPRFYLCPEEGTRAHAGETYMEKCSMSTIFTKLPNLANYELISFLSPDLNSEIRKLLPEGIQLTATPKGEANVAIDVGQKDCFLRVSPMPKTREFVNYPHPTFSSSKELWQWYEQAPTIEEFVKHHPHYVFANKEIAALLDKNNDDN